MVRLALFLLFTSQLLFSQDKQEKVLIAVYEFQYDHQSDYIVEDLSNSVTQQVISTFQNSGRFQVLDRTDDNLINQEIKLQKTRDHISNSMVSAGKRLGARYVLTGEIDRLFAEKKRTSDGTVYYNGDVSFTIKIIDIEKNSILATERLSSSGGILDIFSGKTGSPVSAIEGALKTQTKKMNKFIEKNFGKAIVQGQIVEILEGSGNSAEKVLISVVAETALKKKNIFIVYIPTETKVGGKVRIRERQIGEIEIELVEDEEFSICKVKKGRDQIRRYINEGTTVYIKLKEKKGIIKL